jgi:hypothetical protein
VFTWVLDDALQIYRINATTGAFTFGGSRSSTALKAMTALVKEIGIRMQSREAKSA